MKKEWAELAAGYRQLTREVATGRHSHLVSDLRTMIAHAGDTSNLILDSDLDSYYLMDVTLAALPQTQDRMAAVMTDVEGLLKHGALTGQDRIRLSVQAALPKEADLDHINASAQTALNEDANFHGTSASLHANLPPLLRDYTVAAGEIIALTARLASAEKSDLAVDDYLAAGTRARAASFKLWNAAVDELDTLLERRIDDYKRSRKWAVALVATALALAGLFAFAMARSIHAPLRQLADLLTGSVTGVADAAGQLTHSSQSLAAGSSEQAAAIEETSAALEEMASMTGRNAENAAQAKVLANQARMAADTGATDIQEMTSAMDAMKDSSDNIAKIIKTIDEVAFQTNILALNAAVEAARAGEAGMGFAVVAEEVRNLAQRSAQAAKETAARIEDSILKSAHGARINRRVAGGFQEIAGKVRQVDDLVAGIATASKEQSQGISQVNTAVTQMDQVTQQNAANAEESAGAAEELSTQANSLKAAIGELMHLVGDHAEATGSPPSPRPGERQRATMANGTPRIIRSNGTAPVALPKGRMVATHEAESEFGSW